MSDNDSSVPLSEERRKDLVKARKTLYDAITMAVECISLDAVEVTSPEIDELDELMNRLMGKLCAVVGHQAIPDHCNKPEHDYCEWCRVTVPGGWTGRKPLQ